MHIKILAVDTKFEFYLVLNCLLQEWNVKKTYLFNLHFLGLTADGISSN